MVNVDPDGKSDKTLKTEELEVLVRLLNSNLESLRLLPREASIQQDVALNNRLLTARISALSALITFLSAGEISQILESNVSPHHSYSTTLSTLSSETTSTIPRMPISKLGSLVDYDTDDDDEDDDEDDDDDDDDDDDEDDNDNKDNDEDHDDDDEDDNDNKDNDEDHDDKENDEEKETTQPNPIHFSGPRPRPNIFPTIRPLIEVFHTGIQEVPSPPRFPPTFPENHQNDHRNNHDRTNTNIIFPLPPSPTPTPTSVTGLGRSEYETRDISSIDQRRRPVLGIPAPVLRVPSQAIAGGAGPSRGNLLDLRRSRRPVFPLPMIGVFGDGFLSSVDDVDNPRKRRLEEREEEEEDYYFEQEEEDEEEDQGGIRNLDEYMRPYDLATPHRASETPSKRKAKRSKLSLSSEDQNITYPLNFSTFDSSPSPDIAFFRTTASESSGAIPVCHDPGPSSSSSFRTSTSNTFGFPLPYQVHTEEASEDKDVEVEAATTTIKGKGKGKARHDESDEDSSHTPLHEGNEKEKESEEGEEEESEEEGKSNRGPHPSASPIFFPAPSGLDVPGSLRLVVAVDSGASGQDNPQPRVENR